MSEPSYCEHRYRRDVETCPWCELAEAEAEVRRLQELDLVMIDRLGEMTERASRAEAELAEARSSPKRRKKQKESPLLLGEQEGGGLSLSPPAPAASRSS